MFLIRLQKIHCRYIKIYKINFGGLFLKNYVIFSDSPEKTEMLGFLLGKVLKKNDIVLLDGDLGAGKTCLTKGLTKGLGIDEHTSSPTYTLVNEYCGGGVSLYHYDAYRLSSGDELYEIGFEENIGEGVIVVEWAVNVKECFPENAISIFIERLDDEGPSKRRIKIAIDENRGDLIVNSLS